MSLKDYKPKTHELDLSGAVAVLRPLSLTDVVALIVNVKDDLEKLFAMAESYGLTAETADSIAPEKLLAFAPKIAAQLPQVVGYIIAQSCGEPEAVDIAANLPLPKQVEALTEIAKLTFVDEAGFMVFVGNVAAALEGGAGVVDRVKARTAALPR